MTKRLLEGGCAFLWQQGGMRILTKRNPYFSDDPNIVVFELDPATMQFLSVNGNVEALMGFPREAWMTPTFWPDRVHPDDRDEVMAFCLACIEDKRDHELEYRVVDAAGDTKWVHEIMEFGPAEPGKAALRGYIMDISQRVAQETDIKNALAMRDELLRIVSEELSYPVNEISGFSTMLERHLSAQRDDVGSDYVIGVRAGVERLKGLIEQLRNAPDDDSLDFEQISRELARLSTPSRESEIC